MQAEEEDNRRALERRLRRSEACLNRMFKSSAVASALLDRQAHIVQVNPAMRALTGLDAPEPSDDRLVSRVRPPHGALITDLCRSGVSDATFEAQLERADGTVASVACLMSTVTSPGRARWMVMQMVDIGDRKAAEELSTFRSLHHEPAGLSNRRLLAERLRAALGAGRRKRQKTAVGMMGLDRLEEVDDGLGHGAGDAMPGEVARRLEAVTRRATEG